MDWIARHIGSMGFQMDYYIPTRDDGAGNGAGNRPAPRPAFSEQNRRPVNPEPRVEITKKDGVTYISKFYEWEQFLDWVDWRGKEHRRRSQLPESKLHFAPTLTKNFADAMHLARCGWDDCITQIQHLDKMPLIQFRPIQTPTLRYDIAGGMVDIGRYLAGAPDHMRRMDISDRFSIPARVMKLDIYVYWSIDTSPHTILEQGYKMFQIVETLEMANIRTEIVLRYSSNAGERFKSAPGFDEYTVCLRLKKAEERIYPEKLLFVLAHPAFYRRLVFSEYERNNRSILSKFHFYYEPSQPGYYGPHEIRVNNEAENYDEWRFYLYDSKDIGKSVLNSDAVNQKLAQIFAERYDKMR